jgi:hypothetical protein
MEETIETCMTPELEDHLVREYMQQMVSLSVVIKNIVERHGLHKDKDVKAYVRMLKQALKFEEAK